MRAWVRTYVHSQVAHICASRQAGEMVPIMEVEEGAFSYKITNKHIPPTVWMDAERGFVTCHDSCVCVGVCVCQRESVRQRVRDH